MKKRPVVLATFLLDSSKAFQSSTCRTLTHQSINALAPRKSLLPLSAEQPSSIIGPINENIWNTVPPIRIEGNSLKTWAFSSGTTERVQVSIQSTGRPIEASVELWQTPCYTPTKFTVECEDGSESIVHSIIELPKGQPATVAVYNREGQEFPMDVSVVDMGNVGTAVAAFQGLTPQYIEGGKAVKSFTFGHDVECVEVLLQSNMRNMKARIEILQGPNDDDELIEVETDNANMHPFYTVIQTPGGANTLRIVNENLVEFPLEAFVRPFETTSDETVFNYGGPYF